MSNREIESYINEILTDDDKKNALDFTKYLRENDLIFKRDMGYWAFTHYWWIMLNEKCLCFILINGGEDESEPLGWTVWYDYSDSEHFDEYNMDEQIKETVWKHVDLCGNCGGCDIPGGNTKKIFGLEFNNVCVTSMRIKNPNTTELEWMKKIIEISKNDILRENNLDQIAKSYDRHFIEYGDENSLAYDNLPDYITNDPDYFKWKSECDGENIDSESIIDIESYLSPAKDMKFIQLGCSVSLMTKGYDKWPSLYHGVDISNETIKLLNSFVAENELHIGSLYCGSVHETPFEDSYFDIGDCIGVLEYYTREFVEKALIEFHRIIKPDGKFVLDIPNIKSPNGRVMMLIEECMGRPDKFDLSPDEFESMIEKYFYIEKSNRAVSEKCGYMTMVYCLRCNKKCV